jgi:hypothetical protein
VRDLRAGELRLLMVAVTLAVAALTSVGFFADRLQGGLQRDALQLLGGDAVVASDNPTPPAFAERARALGLQTVTTMGFPTMGRASDVQGGATKLVALKSVEPGYPCAAACRWPIRPMPWRRSRAIFLRRARCGWTPPCWKRWGCRWATCCCWAMPSCALHASSWWSPTGARAS